MAFLPQTTKLQGQQATDPSQQQGQTAGSGQAVPLGGSSGGGVISGTSGSAPTGAGGQGSWTNIQAYLDANKGDTGSAGMLSKDATDVYGKEKQNVDTQASQAQTDAQKQADQVNYSQDQASKLLQDAGKNYNYDSTQPQNSAYSQDTSQLKNALSAQYSGPTNFAYQTSADTQNFGQGLQNNSGFNQIMSGLYNKAGGGNMTQGQLALQNQLDVGNQALNQARQNAIAQYSGLGDYINSAANTTDQAIQGAQDQFTQNQQNLKGYLNNEATTDTGAIQSAEDQARTAYQNAFQTGQSDQTGAFNTLANSSGGMTYAFPESWMTAANPTWQDLQNEQDVATGKMSLPDYANTYGSTWGNILNGNLGWGSAGDATRNTYQQNLGALNNFYQNQENQYANTGDDQKREYNSIMDILGNSNRLNQGFDVRGT